MRRRVTDRAGRDLLGSLAAGERVVIVLPVTTGLHPFILAIPLFLILVTSLGTERTRPSDTAVLFLLVLVLAGLNYLVTKPKRLVLTDHRLLTCATGAFGGITRVERSDPFGGVRAAGPRSDFPMFALDVLYADGSHVLARLPRIWRDAATDLSARLLGATPIPPRPD